MILKIIFRTWLSSILIVTTSFAFTNPFASSFKDPTHEECRQWARNQLYAGTVSGSIFLWSSYLAFNSNSAPAIITLSLYSLVNGLIGGVCLLEAYQEYLQHKNPQKSAEWLAYQKQFRSYKNDITQLRKDNENLQTLLHNKQLQLGVAAIALGFLTGYSKSDNSNPSFILTCAGAALLTEKIISELRKL